MLVIIYGDFMDKPLALKLAPKSLSDVIGQKHLVGEGMILSNMIKNKKINVLKEIFETVPTIDIA